MSKKEEFYKYAESLGIKINDAQRLRVMAMDYNQVSSRLLLRIAADLQKELIRQTNAMVKADLETQIEGLKALHKEVEDYRMIKRLLNPLY